MKITITLEVPNGTTEEQVRELIGAGASWILDQEVIETAAERALLDALRTNEDQE